MNVAKLASRTILGSSLVLGVGLLFLHTASAQTVVQSFTATQTTQNGMIVTLASGQSNAVALASTTTAAKMLGVVVNPSQTSVTLSTGASGQQVYVATSGSYNVLVSNENGPIITGDYIAISSLDGIGAKAGAAQSYVVGKATGGFDGKNDVINTVSLTTGSGQKESVSLGEVPVSISIGHNPLQIYQAPNVPGFLQHITQDVTNKQVTADRIYLSFALVCLTIIVVIVMLYAGVRNGMVAIGRNPLSKRSIIRVLWQVILTGIIVLVVGLLAAYLLLRL